MMMISLKTSFARLFVFLTFCFLAHEAFADAYVCADAQGKKIFSSEPCAKRGMKASTADFPVRSGQVMNAVVVTTPKPYDAKAAELSDKRVLYLDKPVEIFFMFMFVGIAGLFCLIFFLFYRAYHTKLSID